MSIFLALTEKRSCLLCDWALGAFQTSACWFFNLPWSVVCMSTKINTPCCSSSSIWPQMWPIELILYPVHSTCWDTNFILFSMFKSKTAFKVYLQISVKPLSKIRNRGAAKCLMFWVVSRFQSINFYLKSLNHFEITSDCISKCFALSRTKSTDQTRAAWRSNGQEKTFHCEVMSSRTLTSWDEKIKSNNFRRSRQKLR